MVRIILRAANVFSTRENVVNLNQAFDRCPDQTNVFFSEYLVTKGQFQTLLEYCFVLGSWCARGQSSRAFLQGQAHLVFGDYSKALDCFVYAVQNIGK